MWKYIVFVFLGACSYGILSTFVKLAYDDGFTVQQVVGSQMLYGALMMGVMSLLFSRVSFHWKEWARLGLLGTTIALTSLFYYGSLLYIPASLAILLLFQFTWIGVLLDSILSKRRPDKTTFLSLVILWMGTLLGAGVLEGNADFTWEGIVLGLLGAISYSLFILYSGRVQTSMSAVANSAVTVWGALLLILIVNGPGFMLDGSLASSLSLWGALLGLFGMVVPTLFFAIGVKHTGGTLASILGAAELPTAVFMSALVLKEAVSLWQWLGVGFILGAMVWPQWAAWKNARLQS
ncbi:EamA family transporter [Marinicrinis sediminis]|uniref:DMT family transporter n=1 Tax=Marinicrinis sediminis TaxID=1652465 RepID=A0ABW5RAK9_9BACL